MEKERNRLQSLEEENGALRARLKQLENSPLQATFDLFKGIIDSNQDLISALDTEFRFLAFNSAYKRKIKRVFGVDIEVGSSLTEVLGHLPEDREKALEFWGRALRGETFKVVLEYQGIGSPEVFEGHWHPLRDSRGEIIGAAHIGREVTDRARAEEALRKSEEQFRAFFENVAIGTCQVALDGRFLRVNDRFCQITGYSREELLGMTPLDITHPDDVERNREALHGFMRGDIAVYESEKRYLCRSGRTIWVQLTSSLVRDARQQPVCVVSLVQDITDRKTANARLRTLAAVVENSSDFISLATPEMKLFYINPAGRKMVGLNTMEEIEKTCIFDYFLAEDRSTAERDALAELENLERCTRELRFRHFKSGEPIEVLWNTFRIRGETGEPIAWATVGSDISRHVRLERELQAAKEGAEEACCAKSEFLANTSHEIRTPMTIFMAALEHLLEIDFDPERRQFLEMAEKSAQRLRTLIDDILDFSKIEARRVEILEEPFDLKNCLRNAVDILAVLAEEKGLRLETEISPEVPGVIAGDADRLTQVLLNLLDNAVKYTEQGRVGLAVEVQSRDLVFSVSDTGIGIPEEKRSLLFQSFSRVGAGRHRQVGGTGLGLAICKGLVALMGGELGMRPRPGGGSVFFFKLPLKTSGADNNPLLADRGQAQTEPTLAAARILLVEDDPAIRNLIRMLLDQRCKSTVLAGSGREALAAWRAGEFDLILMDLQLPEMDGLEAAGEIRRLEKQRGAGYTPIIGLTAHARHEVREKCLAVGMDDFLTKPVRKEDLFVRIAEILKGEPEATGIH